MKAYNYKHLLELAAMVTKKLEKRNLAYISFIVFSKV